MVSSLLSARDCGGLAALLGAALLSSGGCGDDVFEVILCPSPELREAPDGQRILESIATIELTFSAIEDGRIVEVATRDGAAGGFYAKDVAGNGVELLVSAEGFAEGEPQPVLIGASAAPVVASDAGAVCVCMTTPGRFSVECEARACSFANDTCGFPE